MLALRPTDFKSSSTVSVLVWLQVDVDGNGTCLQHNYHNVTVVHCLLCFSKIMNQFAFKSKNNSLACLFRHDCLTWFPDVNCTASSRLDLIFVRDKCGSIMEAAAHPNLSRLCCTYDHDHDDAHNKYKQAKCAPLEGHLVSLFIKLEGPVQLLVCGPRSCCAVSSVVRCGTPTAR